MGGYRVTASMSPMLPARLKSNEAAPPTPSAMPTTLSGMGLDQLATFHPWLLLLSTTRVCWLSAIPGQMSASESRKAGRREI